MLTSGVVIDHGILGGELYTRLVEESYKVGAFVEDPLNLSGHAQWGDPSLIKHGIQFVRRNLIAASLMGSIAFLLVDTPRVRDVTLRSGSYHDKARTLKVLARGFRHYYEFFQDENLLDPRSKGHQFVTKVRKRHLHMAQQSLTLGGGRNPLPTTLQPPQLDPKTSKLLAAIRQDTSGFQEPPNVTRILLDKEGGFTQFDMMTGHFSFSSILTLFPSELGVGVDDPQGLAGFAHLWAVIGSIMGVQDRYNVALHINDTVSQKQILNHIILASIKYMDEEVMSIPATICKTVPLCPINGLMYFLLHGIFGLEATQVEEMMTWYDRLFVRVVSGVMRLMAGSSLFRAILNGIISTLTPILLKLFLLLYGEVGFFN